MGSRSRGQEVVFCHACENEWYKEQHGLTCPSCDGNFTEIIEQHNDPRSARDNSPPAPSRHQHPLHDHNPWANAPDPDEDDIEDADPHPPGHFPGRRSRPGDPESNTSPLYDAISSIFNGIASNAPPNMSHHQGPPRFDARDNPERPRGGSRQTSGPAPGQPHVHIYSNAGPGYSFTARSSAYSFGRNEDHGRQVPMPDLSALMNNIFQNIHQAGPGGAPPNFSALFNQALTGNAGDYLASDEELERFLAHQHDLTLGQQTSAAPPPADINAIASLPRVAATQEILGLDPKNKDPEAEMDCSICTTGYKVGDTVVTLPCTHWYCETCIVNWLNSHDTCPICRVGIVAKTAEGDGGGNAAGGARVRGPNANEAMHDHRPQSVARNIRRAERMEAERERERAGSSRQYPIVVDESPTTARRSGGGGGGGGRREPSGSHRRRHDGGSGSSSVAGPSGSSSNSATPRLGDRLRGWLHGSDGGEGHRR